MTDVTRDQMDNWTGRLFRGGNTDYVSCDGKLAELTGNMTLKPTIEQIDELCVAIIGCESIQELLTSMESIIKLNPDVTHKMVLAQAISNHLTSKINCDFQMSTQDGLDCFRTLEVIKYLIRTLLDDDNDLLIMALHNDQQKCCAKLCRKFANDHSDRLYNCDWPCKSGLTILYLSLIDKENKTHVIKFLEDRNNYDSYNNGNYNNIHFSSPVRYSLCVLNGLGISLSTLKDGAYDQIRKYVMSGHNTTCKCDLCESCSGEIGEENRQACLIMKTSEKQQEEATKNDNAHCDELGFCKLNLNNTNNKKNDENTKDDDTSIKDAGNVVNSDTSSDDELYVSSNNDTDVDADETNDETSIYESSSSEDELK